MEFDGAGGICTKGIELDLDIHNIHPQDHIRLCCIGGDRR